MIVCMNFDIVIVGGGLVGASLTAALKHSGLSLALVESQSSLMKITVPKNKESAAADWDNRIYAISPGSRSFLERTGAWALLDEKRIAPVEKMRVFGDTGSELEFSAYQMGVAELACILENRALHQALRQLLEQQENLTLFQPAQCSTLKVDEDFASLTLEDGRVLNAKLVVGADGNDSWIRNQSGMGAAPVDYQQQGVVANFSTELPHRGVAYQWFQTDGILALLPLPGNHVSMVWSVSKERSSSLLSMSNDELCEQVVSASGQLLGELKLATSPASFPLRMLTLPKITSSRVALIGDAAHNMHPLAGQGVNTGFRDARQLAQILLERGAQNDCGDEFMLRRYERKRKEDIYTMQATTYGLKNLFNNDDTLLRAARNLGLNATDRLTPIKKMLMQHALN